MYEITASVSEALCSSGTDVDFDVPYCHNCQRIKDLQRTKDLEAKERYFGKLFECYRGIEEQYPPRRDARRAWDRARIKLANHRAATEEIGKDSSSRPILPSELPNYDHGLAQGSRGRTVRIDDEQEGFVDESQYRARQKYFRRHHDYSPGRHADSTGCGFEDTGGWSAFKLEKRSLQQPEEPCSGRECHFPQLDPLQPRHPSGFYPGLVSGLSSGLSSLQFPGFGSIHPSPQSNAPRARPSFGLSPGPPSGFSSGLSFGQASLDRQQERLVVRHERFFTSDAGQHPRSHRPASPFAPTSCFCSRPHTCTRTLALPSTRTPTFGQPSCSTAFTPTLAFRASCQAKSTRRR